MPDRDSTAEFEALATPQIDALLRTARRLVRDPGEAEDLVQDALLKGYRFFDRFERDSNFKAWIFKILMNTFVNVYRQKRRRGPTVDAELAAELEAEVSPNAGLDEIESFGAKEEAMLDLVDDRIRQAVLDLPEHLRIVFGLSAIEDLKYREIAEVLEVPVGTVMSRLFRARAMLKERLRELAATNGIEESEP
ncbi:MAG: sigma-70 family RNA polymerase sigma factor [Planctomycetes bacterium]|nr:sigma-70 family RNA polymerase sigma factor [Planctomycetota bacterium]